MNKIENNFISTILFEKNKSTHSFCQGPPKFIQLLIIFMKKKQKANEIVLLLSTLHSGMAKMLLFDFIIHNFILFST